LSKISKVEILKKFAQNISKVVKFLDVFNSILNPNTVCFFLAWKEKQTEGGLSIFSFVVGFE